MKIQKNDKKERKISVSVSVGYIVLVIFGRNTQEKITDKILQLSSNWITLNFSF